MRALIFVIIVVVRLRYAVATGLVQINQVRPARAPQVSTAGKGITAKGGQAPAFDVQTGSVQVGTRTTTVKVPDVHVASAGRCGRFEWGGGGGCGAVLTSARRSRLALAGT